MSLEQKSQPTDVSAKSPAPGAATLNYGFHPKAVLLVVCSVKNCLPQVVKDRCPLLKVIPNKSKAAFVFNCAKDKVFWFLWHRRRKNFTLCLWNSNYQDSGELPWFFIFLFLSESLSWKKNSVSLGAWWTWCRRPDVLGQIIECNDRREHWKILMLINATINAKNAHFDFLKKAAHNVQPLVS